MRSFEEEVYRGERRGSPGPKVSEKILTMVEEKLS
jgi:hypothetical protein